MDPDKIKEVAVKLADVQVKILATAFGQARPISKVEMNNLFEEALQPLVKKDEPNTKED